MSLEVRNQSVQQIIEGDFHFARVLDSYGIDFFRHEPVKLEHLCQVRQIKLENLLDKWAKANRNFSPSKGDINAYPVNLIIPYLRHNHFVYIKERLPFIRRLIENLEADNLRDVDLTADLKFVFPLFLEDFINHIYEEEDSLFAYIMQLHKVHVSKSFSGGLYFSMEQYSIQELAHEHSEDDDEMSGIRGILDQYSLDELENLHLKVIFQELKEFDQELAAHAAIENEILFPKALNLEKKVKAAYSSKIRFN